MLARKYRLPTSEFFQRHSRSLSSDALRVKIKTNNKGYNRFAVVISSKAEKKAVRRHYWKRLIYDAVGAWPKKISSDIIIIIAQRIQTTSPQQVKEQLSELRNHLPSTLS